MFHSVELSMFRSVWSRLHSHYYLAWQRLDVFHYFLLRILTFLILVAISTMYPMLLTFLTFPNTFSYYFKCIHYFYVNHVLLLANHLPITFSCLDLRLPAIASFHTVTTFMCSGVTDQYVDVFFVNPIVIPILSN